ncbi:hypothetical protein ACFLUA_00410 [Chloroflexota bacterium]
MIEVKRISLVKPTIHTPYHIDFNWWSNRDREWRVYLRSLLCTEHQDAFSNVDIDEQVDWVDPDTAEVLRVDGLQNILITHCAKKESFINRQTTLVDSVFRIFLANGNSPLMPEELGEQLGRDANNILRTLSGTRVYKGLRPYLEN